jgi:hypothetical protein
MYLILFDFQTNGMIRCPKTTQMCVLCVTAIRSSQEDVAADGRPPGLFVVRELSRLQKYITVFSFDQNG